MQQQGGSQYGVHPPPDMTPFSSPGDAPRAHILGISTTDPLQQQPPPQPQLAEAASPISSRPPPPGTAPRPPSSNFDELVPAVPGNFPDDEALAAAGEEVERSGGPGNRWPRQETLALLKIRSEMDAAFRDATLKGPLWEDVSRRLAELGYKRSAKKCKEKFENVHKYYKRTKEGRAGRQDGKSYRFFSQLEALHSSSSSSSAAAPGPATAPALTTAAAAANPTPTTPIGMSTGMAGPSFARIQPPPISAVAPPPIPMPPRAAPELTPSTAGVTPAGISATAAAAAAAGISFSSNTSSSSSSESDDEETEEAGGSREGRKRKRSGSGSSRKMMAFFEGLMRQVMERQESMQQRFLETIERREQDRMIREEAWRRQEMARLNREHELLAQERAMAASRDAAVISYIQKISGQTIQMPNMTATAITVAPPPQPSSVAPPPAPPQQQTQQPQQRPPTQMQPSQQQQQQQQELHQQPQSTETGRHQVSSSSELVPVPEPQEPVGTVSFEPVSSSRWPKAEVHALIKMRSGLDSRYQEAGPKGPLWEEISAGMQRLGYNRSAKRCKEKWENINKYFKKVKESNKKRPEDAKTCPYFHQLDALYRKKLLASSAGGSSGGTAGIQRQQEQETSPSANPQEGSDVPMIMAPPEAPPPPAQLQQPSAETERKNGNNNNNNGNNSNNRNGSNSEGGGGSGTVQMQTSNGGLPPSLFEEGSSGSGMTMKKPEGTVKELRDQRRQQATMEAYDKMEEADSDNIDQDDDDDDDEDDEDGKMQYKIEFQRPNVGGGGGTASTAAATAGSFLAMVQ